MKYTSNDDLFKAFNGTIVVHENLPFYAQVERELVHLHKFTPELQLSPISAKKISGKQDFVFTPVKLGFVPDLIRGALYYTSRSTRRQWIVGACDRNITSYECKGNIFSEADFTLNSKQGYKLILNIYRPLEEVLQYYGGVSNDFGVYKDNLYHKTALIGKTIPGVKGVKIFKPFFNSLMMEKLQNVGFEVIEEHD